MPDSPCPVNSALQLADSMLSDEDGAEHHGAADELW